MQDLAEIRTTLPDYVRRYLDGESVQTLAAEHHVAPRTIYRWMMAELGDQYQHAVTNVLVDRIADADLALAVADDPCQIARAREQARFARMDFERRRPHLYGQRQQITHDIGPDLGNLLREARARVVSTDCETVDATPQLPGKSTDCPPSE